MISALLAAAQQVRGPNTRKRFDAATTQAQDAGRAAEATYMDRASSYNAADYAANAARGAYGAISRRLTEDLGDLRGDQAAMGRLRTGWGQGDEDRLYTSALDRLNDVIAQSSMQAAGLDLQNTQGIGSYGTRKTEMANEMISGQLDRETAERNARAARRGGLFGSLASAAGTVLGGPLGGAIAKRITGAGAA